MRIARLLIFRSYNGGYVNNTVSIRLLLILQANQACRGLEPKRQDIINVSAIHQLKDACVSAVFRARRR